MFNFFAQLFISILFLTIGFPFVAKSRSSLCTFFGLVHLYFFCESCVLFVLISVFKQGILSLLLSLIHRVCVYHLPSMTSCASSSNSFFYISVVPLLSIFMKYPEKRSKYLSYWLDFLLQSLIARGFLDLLRYSFFAFFFFHQRLLDGVHYLIYQAVINFLFYNCSEAFLIGSYIPSLVFIFHFSIISMAYFSTSNPIPKSTL